MGEALKNNKKLHQHLMSSKKYWQQKTQNWQENYEIITNWRKSEDCDKADRKNIERKYPKC